MLATQLQLTVRRPTPGYDARTASDGETVVRTANRDGAEVVEVAGAMRQQIPDMSRLVHPGTRRSSDQGRLCRRAQFSIRLPSASDGGCYLW
jgi:hypothetical protein